MTMTDDTTTEAVDAPSVEIVKQEAPPQDHTGGALDRAAEAALAMPGVPGRDEFLSLAMQARILSMSGAAPEAVRNNPYIAFHVAMVGRDLGISPSAALAQIDVISTKKGPQLSLSPQLMNGQIARLKLGKIVPGERTTERATAIAVDMDGVVLGESEFTWEDARMAGLVGKNCHPGDHKQGDKGCGCNQGYRTYPKRMLWWRAAGFCADDFFPEAQLGLYSPEELGAVVDVEGRPIDPTSVELPPGYEPAPPPPPELSDPDELWELQLQIQSLSPEHGAPAEVLDKLRKRYVERVVDADGRGYSPSALPPSMLRLAQALVKGSIAEAKRATKNEWDPDAAVAAVRAECAQIVASCLTLSLGAQSASEPREQPSAAERTDDAPEGSQSVSAGDDEPAAAFPKAESGHAPAEQDDDSVLRELGDVALDLLITRAKNTSYHDVDKALTQLRLSSEGNVDTRRRRLVIAWARQSLAEDRS